VPGPVAAITIVDALSMRAIPDAAVQQRAPVILQTSVRTGVGSDEVAEQQGLDVALDFTRTTGVDVLAPAIGNAHVTYRPAPTLDVQEVSDIVAATGTPIALHGGSGVSDGQFRELVSRGCAKRQGVVSTAPTLVLDCDGTLANTEWYGHLPAFHRMFAEAGLALVWSEDNDADKLRIGEYCTSLDMAGVSLTLVLLDEKIEGLLAAPADIPIRAF